MTLEQLLPIAQGAARTHQVGPLVLLALWWIESRWDARAVNPHTLATGLGQVIPSDYGGAFSDRPNSEELLDPAVNADWSARILRQCLDHRRDDLRSAVKDYSGGWRSAGDDAFDRIYWQPFLRKYRELAEEEFLMQTIQTKLGAHVQEAYPQATAHLQQALYPAMKVMGNVSPGAVQALLAHYDAAGRPRPLVWRREWTDDSRDDWVRQGEAGAVHFFEHTIRAYERWRHITNIVESVNEFIPWTESDMRSLNDFEARLCELFHAAGFKVVVGNFSVGWPRLEHWDYYKDALIQGDYLGLHEYWWPSLPDDGWRTLRYRRALETLKGFPRVPPILITEVGWDRAAADGGPHAGFRKFGDERRYLEWLKWYDSQLQQDPQVLCAAIFETGAAHDWRQRGFDVVGSGIERELAMYVRGADLPITDPIGETQVQVKAYDWQGNEVALEELQATYGIEIRRAEADPDHEVFRLVAIREKRGDAAEIIRVTSNGEPDVGRAVAWHWPDAPQENPSPTAFDWEPNYLVAYTNSNGEVGPGMGTGAYHDPGEPGPHATWVISPSTPSDAVYGLGMLVGTDHYHVDVEFALVVEPEHDLVGDVVENIRNYLWNHLYPGGVPYNPEAAFPKRARALELGVPVTTEHRVTINQVVYAAQGFALGWLYCREGEWDAIVAAEW
ncbi:MAG: hypothetical protein DRO14_00480 [Thermoprotei archaeon]|nr:MAG: hypothetical protein DRO14_00480 [Thermoprotei archaeon]